MNEPRWLERSMLEEIHRRQLDAHGGLRGVRDPEGLEAVLAHPRQVFAYGAAVDLCALAATYAASISRRHPFVDGNKRTAFMAAYAFVGLNGSRIEADEAEVVHLVRGLAAGEIDEEGFAAWLREVVVAR